MYLILDLHQDIMFTNNLINRYFILFFILFFPFFNNFKYYFVEVFRTPLFYLILLFSFYVYLEIILTKKISKTLIKIVLFHTFYIAIISFYGVNWQQITSKLVWSYFSIFSIYFGFVFKDKIIGEKNNLYEIIRAISLILIYGVIIEFFIISFSLHELNLIQIFEKSLLDLTQYSFHENQQSLRIRGLTQEPSYFACIFSLSIAWFYAYYERINYFEKLLTLSAFLILIFFSSKSFLLLFSISLIIKVYISLQNFKLFTNYTLPILIFFIFYISYISISSIVHNLESNQLSIIDRTGTLIITIKTIIDNPFGVGYVSPDKVIGYIPDTHIEFYSFSKWFENRNEATFFSSYLRLINEVGLFFIFSSIYFIIHMMRIIYPNKTRYNKNFLFAFYLLLFCSISSAFVDNLYNFILLFAIGYLLSFNERATK